jgi:uncharacterized membrane protein YkvA (DUF1232 family)
MAAQVKSWLARSGRLRMLLSHLRLAARLLRDPRVPLLMKALPLLAAVYVISPLDFVPDVLPVLGQLDDIGIILIGLEAFVRVCPAAAVAFHQTAIAANHRYSPMPPTDDFIDAEWRRG